MNTTPSTTIILCTLAALFALTACGSEESPTATAQEDMSSSADMPQEDVPQEDLGTDTPDMPADMGQEPLDPNGDNDGDGLTNQQELDGWMVSVDRIGLGEMIAERVTSDPRVADSDNDGLTDAEEFQRTDPNKPDTDGDGLTDADEVNVYLSIPTSVDTDGDSVSGATSNIQLWDGEEINKWGTSPSLSDTDGDNRSDFEEIISNATNPLVAQVPLVDVSFEGNIDISLNVSYEDAELEDQSYGVSLSSGESTTRSRTNGTAVTNSTEKTESISASVESGLPPSASVSVSRSTTTGYSNTTTSSITAEEGRTAQREHNRLQSNGRQYTEAVSTGNLSMGMIISNPSEIAYTLTNITVTVYAWNPGSNQFRTVGTMTPNELGEVNLAPGGSTESPIQVNAENLNSDLIRQFMRSPKSLVFSVSNFDIQNSEGLNFVFLEEVTQSRTGRVVIDYGDGQVEDMRVATNVRRNGDGSLAGVKLSTVFEKYLEIPYETKAWASDITEGPLVSKIGTQVLTKVRDLENSDTREDGGFWIIFSDMEDLRVGHKDFGEAVLQRGETLNLFYMRDMDGDGVYDREEEFHQSSDERVNSDNDMLSDFEEVKEGWIAGTGLTIDGYPRQVYSSPASEDADEDGLDDFAEREAGTDPNNADTDGDGAIDGLDGNPLSNVNEPPIITLEQTFEDPIVTLTGTIIDAVDEIESVLIDWGDGFTNAPRFDSDTFNVSHGYFVPGTYTVTITATDVRQATSTETFTAVTTTSPYAFAYYPMDGNLLIDATGNNNGTIFASSGFNQLQQEDRLMTPNAAMRFEGDFQSGNWAYGIVNNLGNLDLENFSIAFWNNGAETDKIIMHQPQRVRMEGANGRNICVSFGQRDGAVRVCSTGDLDNDWNFFAVTHDGDQLRIYVNGVLNVSTPYELSNNISNCGAFHFNGALGCDSTMPSGSSEQDEFSRILIDDVRIFMRVISASSVETLYRERGYTP